MPARLFDNVGSCEVVIGANEVNEKFCCESAGVCDELCKLFNSCLRIGDLNLGENKTS